MKPGRKKKEEGEKAINSGITLYPEDMEKLQEIADNLKMKKSEVIRHLIRQAYTNDTLRAIIEHEEYLRLKAKGNTMAIIRSCDFVEPKPLVQSEKATDMRMNRILKDSPEELQVYYDLKKSGRIKFEA